MGDVYILPEWWACYLINGDASGLEDSEIAEIDSFCEGLGSCVDVSEEPYFSWENDANGLGGDVAEFTFIKVENEQL